MKMKLAISFASLFIASCALGSEQNFTFSTGSSSISGLYLSDGTLVTSSVNLTSVMVTETYDGQNLPSDGYWGPLGGVWKVKLVFKFSSSGWQSISNDTAFGVQLAHYTVGSNPPLNGPIGNATDYFQTPASDAISYTSGTPVPSTNYTKVNPRTFYKGELTIDSNDSTGRSGYVEFNSTSSTSYPWDNFPSGTTLAKTGVDAAWLYPVAWLFPKIGDSGVASAVYPWLGLPYPLLSGAM